MSGTKQHLTDQRAVVLVGKQLLQGQTVFGPDRILWTNQTVFKGSTGIWGGQTEFNLRVKQAASPTHNQEMHTLEG